MAPTDLPLPAWILFAAAIIQTTAAVIQVAQGRRPRTSTATGAGVGPGVRFGLAALVLEFGGWLVARELADDLVLARAGVFAPAVVAGAVAFLRCLGDLLTTPPPPPPPPLRNAPIDPAKRDIWHAITREDNERYERALAASRRSPALAFSLVLGAAGGLAVVYTSLVLGGVLG